jgi:hypothetical protein
VFRLSMVASLLMHMMSYDLGTVKQLPLSGMLTATLLILMGVFHICVGRRHEARQHKERRIILPASSGSE